MAPNNSLPIHGNEKTMNLNHLILTNIQSSPYFKVNLFELKTYHEVIDEIYYKVGHLEPWEKGSRKTAGQTGMCGGVRGVGAGGIVSSAYCLLYKLFTLRLTRKQVIGLLTHKDSPYIRGLGFMYIRYTQPPADLWEWYEEYLDDDEEIDVKAGGGHTMTMGEMARQFLTKLEWYSTLFPRIPVPVQKMIETEMKKRPPTEAPRQEQQEAYAEYAEEGGEDDVYFGEAERIAKLRNRSSSREKQSSVHDRRKSPPPRRHSPQYDGGRDNHRERERQRGSSDRGRRSRSRERRRSRSAERHQKRNRQRSRSRDRERRPSRSRDRKDRKRSRSRERYHDSKSRDHKRNRDDRESSFERDLRRERDRQRKHESKHSHRDRHSDR